MLPANRLQLDIYSLHNLIRKNSSIKKSADIYFFALEKTRQPGLKNTQEAAEQGCTKKPVYKAFCRYGKQIKKNAVLTIRIGFMNHIYKSVFNRESGIGDLAGGI